MKIPISWIRSVLIILFATCLYLDSGASQPVQIIHLSDYGVLPNTGNNSSAIIHKAIQTILTKVNKKQPLVLKFKKGRYDFHPDGALTRTYYISNHDQDNPKTVGLVIEGQNNITIDGQGSDFIYHGRMLPIALIESTHITLKNIHIDFEQPQICQVKILKNDSVQGKIIYQTAPWVTYTIKDSVFYNTGENWALKPSSGIAFEEKTKRIVYNTADIRVGTTAVQELSPGIIQANNWKNSKLIPGTVVAMRAGYRPHPGIFVHKGKDIQLKHITVHYAEGMGLLAQLTDNITLDGFRVALRGSDDPRYFTAQADATHFSGCKGIILSKNGLYENMMDDAINIHGTYLKITKRLDDRTLIGRYMHDQSYGFDWGTIGDTVQFIQSRTMELWPSKNRIQAIEVLQNKASDPIREFKITLQEVLDPAIDPTKLAIGIENLSWTPRVVFSNNTVRHNRARGALFSTPRKTLVEKNRFDHTSGTAILLCGDANGWYETGSCHDIVIRHNTFINALTNMFQFTNAIISIYPEIPDLQNQQQYFHSGIVIEDNLFETFDNPILYAKSVDGLVFRNNRIRTNKEYPAFHWNKKSLFFERVIHSEVSNNTVDGKKNELEN